MKKVMSLIMALALVLALSVSASALSLKDITKVTDITKLTEVTYTGVTYTDPDEEVSPSVVAPTEVVEEEATVAEEEEAAAVTPSKTIANTGDAGLALGATVAAVAAAAYVISKKH